MVVVITWRSVDFAIAKMAAALSKETVFVDQSSRLGPGMTKN